MPLSYLLRHKVVTELDDERLRWWAWGFQRACGLRGPASDDKKNGTRQLAREALFCADNRASCNAARR
jgi:hypothetical protein